MNAYMITYVLLLFFNFYLLLFSWSFVSNFLAHRCSGNRRLANFIAGADRRLFRDLSASWMLISRPLSSHWLGCGLLRSHWLGGRQRRGHHEDLSSTAEALEGIHRRGFRFFILYL